MHRDVHIPSGESTLSTCQSLELVTNLIYAFVWDYSAFYCTYCVVFTLLYVRVFHTQVA